MSTHAIVAACLLALTSSSRFGPNDCVSVGTSPTGTCVLSTDCEGEDLSNVEFAFNCERDSEDDQADTEITWHSYGVGGFDAREEFNTDVQCTRCMAPTPEVETDSQKQEESEEVQSGEEEVQSAEEEEEPSVAAAPVKEVKSAEEEEEAPVAAAPVKEVQSAEEEEEAPVAAAPVKEVKSAEEEEEAPVAAAPVNFRAKSKSSHLRKAKTRGFFSSGSSTGSEVKFGPGGCVKTWKATNNHCIMQTSCAKQDMSGYNYGLVCVDKAGRPERHLFGNGSFAAEETFDTLIICDQCLGLEEIPNEVALAGEITMITQDVASLKEDIKLIKDKVIKDKVIKDKVVETAAIKGPDTVLVMPPAPAPASAIFLKSSKHKTHGKANHGHRHGAHHHKKHRGTHHHAAHHNHKLHQKRVFRKDIGKQQDIES